MVDDAGKEISGPENFPTKELEVDPHSVAIASATSYKNWYSGEIRSSNDTDKIRGDLAIEFMRTASERGYQIVDVDDGSPRGFLDALEKLGIKVINGEDEKGLSADRRAAIKIVGSLSDVQVIITTEPEKISLATQLDKLALPIANGEADIVIPKRNPEAFETYPPVQAKAEHRSNAMANDILRRTGLLKPGEEDIDLWVGVRAFRNDPEIIKIFEQKYDFTTKQGILDEMTNLDMWANTLYLPVVNALHKGLKVKSVPVTYVHPKIQTESEINQPEFDRKRDVQRRDILHSMIQLIRYLQSAEGISTKPSRIKPSP